MIALFILFLVVVAGLVWFIYKVLHPVEVGPISKRENGNSDDDQDGGWPADEYDGPDFDLPPGIYLESKGKPQKDTVLFV